MSEFHSDRRAPLCFLHLRAGCRDQGIGRFREKPFGIVLGLMSAVRPTCAPNRVLQALINLEARRTVSGVERSDRMKKIAVIPGDGIGKEVIPAAIKVVQATCVAVEFTNFDWSADRYLKDGTS